MHSPKRFLAPRICPNCISAIAVTKPIPPMTRLDRRDGLLK